MFVGFVKNGDFIFKLDWLLSKEYYKIKKYTNKAKPDFKDKFIFNP